MMRFRLWLEDNLRRSQQQQVQRIYDSAISQLLGSARDQTHLSLSDIEDDGGPGGPPMNKGATVAFKKLQKSQIFEKLKQLGDPELASRAADTENYLQKAANDQVVGPKDTVGQLLNKLFGDDAVETYGNHNWKSSPSPDAHRPDDNEQPGSVTTSMPMAQQNAPSPTGMPGQASMPPPMDPAMMGMPPQMPGQPPMDPAMMPIQSPGGPLPTPPPGGLQMA